MVVPYIPPHKDLCGQNDPDYDKREAVLDDLGESLSYLELAYDYLCDVLSEGPGYLDEDIDALKDIESRIWALKLRLKEIMEVHRP